MHITFIYFPLSVYYNTCTYTHIDMYIIGVPVSYICIIYIYIYTHTYIYIYICMYSIINR